MTIRDYAAAAAYLGKKANRPLPGRASRLIRRSDESIAVQYQTTDVVTYHADGTATLNSGGWRSLTTKTRMTDYTRASISQAKGVWYVRMGSWDQPACLYQDGMTIDATGLPVEPHYPTKTETERKRALDRLVSAYIKGFATDIATNGIKNPENGDCWGCLFQVKDQPTVTQGAFRVQGKQTPHGRVEPMGISHYIEHLKESYFVPSLLLNAIVAAGYRDPGLIWHMIQSRKDGKMAAGILRGYFRNLKPALLAEMGE